MGKGLTNTVMNVINNIITLARGVLCFNIFTILVGIVWSVGSLYWMEYVLLLVVLFLCSYCVYIGEPQSKKINNNNEALFFLGCFLFFVLCFLLSFLSVINSPGKGFFVFLSLPFLIIYIMKKLTNRINNIKGD